MQNFIIDKFIPCNNCDNGFIFSEDSTKQSIVTTCKCRKEYENINYLKLAIYKSGLSFKILELNLNSYIGDKSINILKKIKLYIKKFSHSYKRTNLYFWSFTKSTQKTTIASIIGKELLKQDFSVQFVLMETLLQYLKKLDFSDNNEQYIKIFNIIKSYYECDFLIIDDCFDTAKVLLYKSKYQLPFLDSFLRRRLEHYCKATCFTSNVAINKISNNFGEAIEKLIERNIIDPMEFKDYIHLKNINDVKKLWG